MQKITKRQEAFCLEYLKSGDKSDAYRKSYSTKNMTTKTINEAASRISKNSKVLARIEELQRKMAVVADKKLAINAEEMLRHLNILRNARIDEYVEFVEYDHPVVTTTTTGSGKNKVTVTTTQIERRTEMRFKTFDQLTPEQLMCVESMKQNRYGEIELKLHGKDWTIEKINRHIGFYEKDNGQKTPTATRLDLSGLPDSVLDAMAAKAKEQLKSMDEGGGDN